MTSIELIPIKIKYTLVFFLLLFLNSCRQHETIDIPEIVYDGREAVGVKFYSNKETTDLHITLDGEDNPAVLGSLLWKTDHFEFIPLIPFTPGQTYNLKAADEVLVSFDIPLVSKENGRLLHWYPKNDTVPQNLLKMHFSFSEPMNEVQDPLEYITVKNLSTNEKIPVFLSLENPLWNEDHTELTLWLDPGRIKKDLIPNKESGMPLTENNKYEIVIADTWPTASGASLEDSYTRTIFVSGIDSIKPVVENIQLNKITKDTRNILDINFNDSWDIVVAIDAIQILTDDGSMIEGFMEPAENFEGLSFKPHKNWKLGNYKVQIETRAEDLAGNNLLRLFDTDLTTNKEISENEFVTIPFEVN